MNNKISHPVHYTQGIECWDYITSHKMGYLEGNIIKYVTRYKYKDGLDDLFKAKAYLQRLIEDQFGPPIVGESPVTGPLNDVKRLNGAIPLGPASANLLGLIPMLDGRNCRPGCDCTGHSPSHVDKDWLPAACAIPFGIADLGNASARAAAEAFDDYCLGDYHRGSRWMKKPWVNE